jgi:nitrite reductase/ring-hydroxylating ferredoxin subunit
MTGPPEPDGAADPDEAGWIRALALSELPEGRHARVTIEGVDVFVYRQGDTVFALDDRCSHMGGPLHKGRIGAVGSTPTITCLFHGSLFLLTDGRVLRGPAMRPQRVHRARIAGDAVEVRLRTDPS